ncbi:MAG: hypothetical protein KDK99_12730 [Verrucomicrobiales bacterium]|nr:hypothetical protein [Verrucomicrobiales bacterium]
MDRKAIAAVLLCFLVSCSTVHRAKRDKDAAIPITFEAYPRRRNVVYDRDTIHTLLKGKCIYCQQLDASKGIPVSLIRERSYRFSKGKIRLPRHGYLKKTEWFRSIIMPNFYQRIGSLNYYLVRFGSDGHVECVIPQKASGVLPDRDLFRLCQPGDKIVAEWFF